MLLDLLRTDQRNETAWLWLSAIIDDPAKETDCLKRVLAINPKNEAAQRHLQKLNPTSAPVPITPAPIAPAPVASTLTTDARADILEHEIQKYLQQGYIVQTRTETTAQLIKKKRFSFILALFLNLLYVFFYLSDKDKTAYIQVNRQGQIETTKQPASIIQAVVVAIIVIILLLCLANLCSGTGDTAATLLPIVY